MMMLDEIQNGWRVSREEGLATLLAKVWMTVVRPYLPRSQSDLMIVSGLKVEHEDARVLDRLIGMPAYESEIIAAMDAYLQQGDDVIEIGGGMGVTTVWAARQVGENGSVLAIEGSITGIQQLQRTLELNDAPDVVTPEHAIVGEAILIRDDHPGEAKHRSPDQLPECDALVLDCEGAEIGILEKMESRPRVIIVETHAHLGAPADEVRELLMENSYRIVSSVGTDGDVAILTAIAKQN